MFCYMFSHEAHHRGQILMLALQLGYRVPPPVWGRIWQWDVVNEMMTDSTHRRSQFGFNPIRGLEACVALQFPPSGASR